MRRLFTVHINENNSIVFSSSQPELCIANLDTKLYPNPDCKTDLSKPIDITPGQCSNIPSASKISLPTCQKFFSKIYTDFDGVPLFSFSSGPGEAKWWNYFLCGIKGVLEEQTVSDPSGLTCLVDGRIPPSAGLSSSSAMVVAAAICKCPTLAAVGRTKFYLLIFFNSRQVCQVLFRDFFLLQVRCGQTMSKSPRPNWRICAPGPKDSSEPRVYL